MDVGSLYVPPPLSSSVFDHVPQGWLYAHQRHHRSSVSRCYLVHAPLELIILHSLWGGRSRYRFTCASCLTSKD